MSTRTAKTVRAEEVAAIEELVGDLEKRLRRLSGAAHREASGASDDVGDFVSESLERIMNRVNKSASGLSRKTADEAKRFGAGPAVMGRKLDAEQIAHLAI